ncbi:hypothetical protein BpHYR1_007721 [Brachionus plicatilis]|uniref:Uncharacterized protein n=1 Tax=Brachionus plicatilis TaxID=10195 RepID=A0A3M7PJA2_BRAPC|nr:hypothetical protein BpHYR1_007721 [Brachionus plicatilis]
MFKILKLQW